MTPIAVEKKSSAGKHRSFPGKCPAQPRKCRPWVDTCIESREACAVCLLQMPSPLSGPCANTLGPLCHFPRSTGDELLSLEDGQAGALPPVGQGPAFSMRPGDGWVRAPRGLAGRVPVSVSLLRLGFCYSLSLGEPQLQFCCSLLFKRDSPHLLGKMKRRVGVKSASRQEVWAVSLKQETAAEL